MTPQDDDFERRLSSWLRADAPAEEPVGLFQAVVTRTAATRRRPGWAIDARWMPTIVIPAHRLPSASHAAWLIAVVAALVAIVAGSLAVGSLHALPAPVGPARAGLIAFDDAGDIVVANPDGTNRRNLTSSPTLETSPSFSPDGTKIAYWTEKASGMPASLWVMNTDGSNQHDVTGSADFSSSEWLQATWSPDSRRLAFSVGDYYSSTQLYVVGADGTALHVVGGGSLSRSDPAWSPDGRLIAFRGHTTGVLPDDYPADPAIGVYVIAPDGTGQLKVSHSAGAGGAPNVQNSSAYAGTYPSWSPDGRSLLFATGATGHHTLAIASIAGLTERALNLPAGDDLLPIFSPDGSQIAFEDYSTSADQAKAYVVNTDGTGLHQVNDGDPIALNPVFWSPDGRIVVSYTLGYLTIQLSAADANGGTGPAVQPSVSIALGAVAVAEDAQYPPPDLERASWQRLAP